LNRVVRRPVVSSRPSSSRACAGPWGLAGGGRGATRTGGRPADAAQFGGERIDAFHQVGEVVAARHTELDQRALHAILEHLLQAVPGIGGAFARGADPAFHRVAHHVGAIAGDLARGLFEVQPFLDQALEQARAFGLRAPEGAHAGQPDLLRRFAQGLRQTLGLRLRGGVGGLLAGGLLELGHGVAREGWVRGGLRSAIEQSHQLFSAPN
jgi:hypothetical protein